MPTTALLLLELWGKCEEHSRINSKTGNTDRRQTDIKHTIELRNVIMVLHYFYSLIESRLLQQKSENRQTEYGVDGVRTYGQLLNAYSCGVGRAIVRRSG